MAFLRAGRWQNAAADRVTLQEICRQIQQQLNKARGLDIMMPEAIDLKVIAALLTGNQLKEGRKKSAGRFRSAARGPIDGCAGVSAQKSVAGRAS
jgi:hypothetical protein